MHKTPKSPTLMRHKRTARKTGLRPAAAALAALLLAACETLPTNEPADISGAAARDLEWSFARTAELEAEVEKLSEENARLTKEIATLQQAKPEPVVVAEAAPAAIEKPPVDPAPRLAPATPPLKPEAVVSAADADKALAGSPAPVDSQPRLVKPALASIEETVFENEAASGEIPLASVLYGVHLASYREADQARAGWRELQRKHPDELGLLEARVESVTLEGRGAFLRLVGGGFSSADTATALCERLKSKNAFCAVTNFNGDRLSLAAERS